MDPAFYHAIIRETIDALPERLRDTLKDTAVVLDDTPPPDTDEELLLGLYDGVPLTEWGRGEVPELPGKITLFTRAIEEYALDDDEIPQVVRETLWHEIAHHFGYEEDQVDVMEERWRNRRNAS